MRLIPNVSFRIPLVLLTYYIYDVFSQQIFLQLSNEERTLKITYEEVEKALIEFVQIANSDDCLQGAQELVLACEFDVDTGTFQKVVLAGALLQMFKGYAISEMTINEFAHLIDGQADVLCCLKAHDDAGATHLITAAIRATSSNGQLRLLADTIIKH